MKKEKAMDKKNVLVVIVPTQMYEQIRDVAYKKNISKARVIRDALGRYFENENNA